MLNHLIKTLVLFGFGSFVSLPAFAGTCALCRQALSIGGSDGLVEGFYWSIVLIAGMPFLVLGLSGFYFYKQIKKHKTNLNISK